jgi:hypothetical protein
MKSFMLGPVRTKRPRDTNIPWAAVSPLSFDDRKGGNDRKFPKENGTSKGNPKGSSTSIPPLETENPLKIIECNIPKMVILSIPRKALETEKRKT